MNHKNPRILSNFRKLPKEGTSLCSTPKEKRSRRKSTERRASDGEIVMEVGWRGRGWRPVGSKQAFFTPPRTRERDQASLRFTRVYAGPRTPAYLLITQPLSSSHPSPTRQLPSPGGVSQDLEMWSVPFTPPGLEYFSCPLSSGLIHPLSCSA